MQHTHSGGGKSLKCEERQKYWSVSGHGDTGAPIKAFQTLRGNKEAPLCYPPRATPTSPGAEFI